MFKHRENNKLATTKCESKRVYFQYWLAHGNDDYMMSVRICKIRHEGKMQLTSLEFNASNLINLLMQWKCVGCSSLKPSSLATWNLCWRIWTKYSDRSFGDNPLAWIFKSSLQCYILSPTEGLYSTEVP